MVKYAYPLIYNAILYVQKTHFKYLYKYYCILYQKLMFSYRFEWIFLTILL